MGCSIGNTREPGVLFRSMADSLSNCTDKMREICSAKVSARTTGVALVVIGLLVAASGIVVAAVGLGCAAPLAAGLVLVVVGSVLLGLGLAAMRSRRAELERQLAAIACRIQNLREEHESLQEIYLVNRDARRAAGEYCQELEQKILDMCQQHAEVVRILEDDARRDKEQSTECFRKRLQQSQDACSRLTEDLCKAKSECQKLQEKLNSLDPKKKK